MSILSDFFISAADPPPPYGGDDDLLPEDRYQARRITPLEAGGMLQVLRGMGDVVTLSKEFELLTAEDADEWTMSVPQDFVAKLAALEAHDVRPLAMRFAKATEAELGWSGEDFEPLVAGLRTLAQRGLAKGMRMYLWNCL